MSQPFDAIFENGVFRPERPVNLPEGERVVLTVVAKPESADDLADVADLLDVEFMEACARRAASAPSLEDVRRRLSAFEGSMAERIGEERDER